jgi:cobalt-zinc-cadmium efflux system membrane fusion protein
VTRVNANIGKFVNANEPMFEIVDTEHLHAELTVFEKDIPRLKIGSKVRFILSNETKERTATVHLIGREIDSDRTIRVHCHLDREDKHMMPGTYRKAWVETGAAAAPSLPDGAGVMEGGKYYAFLALDEPLHFKRLEIAAGVSSGGYTEVLLPDGTPAGAQFAVKGAGDLMAAMTNAGEEGHAH